METLTESKLNQLTTIAFERWIKSDLHKRICFVVLKLTIGRMQIRKFKLRFGNENVSKTIRRIIKSLAKQAETHQSRLWRSYALLNEVHKQLTTTKSLTSDGYKNLTVRKCLRKLKKEPKRLTNVLVMNIILKLNVNRRNLCFAVMKENVLPFDKTKDIKSTLVKHSVD
ncbi:MAG: hypothetical protein ACTS44_00620 [Candidatus Hodgkinia cicadicola]